MEFKPYSQDDMAGCIELFDLNCPRFFCTRGAIRLFALFTAVAGFRIHEHYLSARLARATPDRLFWNGARVVRNLCAQLDHGSSRISAPRLRRGDDGAAFHSGRCGTLSESGYLYQSACGSVFCPIRGRYPAFAKRRLGTGYASAGYGNNSAVGEYTG